MPNIINNRYNSIDYQSLMSRRICRILLICSSYDAFILEEDGRIESQITGEYIDLNLTNAPSFTRVSNACQAMEAMSGEKFDLVITMLNIGETDAFSMARTIKELHPELPIVLLTSFTREITLKLSKSDLSAIDYVFSWQGNAYLILAIIKLIEDQMNAENDILNIGVQSIILVEDSIRYYSMYLPVLYKLVIEQSNEFLKEALNEQQKMLRKRARPKILLAKTYDEAMELYEKYKDNMLGVISDVTFKRNLCGEKSDLGVELCRKIKEDNPLMPVLLQSSDMAFGSEAETLGVSFIHKYSKTLLSELADFISGQLVFGAFTFRNPVSGNVVIKVNNLREMQVAISNMSVDVLMFHTAQNLLSKWFFARGLFALGSVMRSVNNSSFETPEEMKAFILKAIHDYRSLMGQGVIAKFDAASYNEYIWFARMGEGSIGGKARGLAFLNTMLQKYNMYDKYKSVRMLIPRTVVIGADYFDEFIRDNGLKHVINADLTDAEILSEFVSSRLSEELVGQLKSYITTVQKPLAIRSSSKLEDSHYQPFAGIYSTYMIPNTENQDQMLRLVGKAIKSVYASVFYKASRAYIDATSNVLSDESMAVVIQEVCGSEDGGYYFPTISGVARSINFYPIGDEKSDEGIASIALGLGKIVVEGGITLRFSPKYPKKVLQLSMPELALRDTQREMYALDLKPEEFKISIDDAVNLHKFEIGKAAGFRNMKHVASTWDMQNQRISDSFGEGRKIVSFAKILKYDMLPLAEIVSDLLEFGAEEMKNPVEIEFAVNMDVPYGEESLFNVLQIRPIVEGVQTGTIDWKKENPEEAIIYAESALGLGKIENLTGIIYVRNETFNPATTEEIAREIERLNIEMVDSGGNYILVGPGRWGSSDSWLGIPVKWSQISAARVIVECGLPNFRVDPSQGTHFFQNLTSFGVGYMTINPFMNDGRFDIEKLDNMPAVWESKLVRHVRFPEPMSVFIDGKNNKGIVKV